MSSALIAGGAGRTSTSAPTAIVASILAAIVVEAMTAALWQHACPHCGFTFVTKQKLSEFWWRSGERAPPLAEEEEAMSELVHSALFIYSLIRPNK